MVLGAGDEAFSALNGEATFETVEVGWAVPEEDVGVFQQDGASIAVVEGNHLPRGEVTDERDVVGVVGYDGGISCRRVLVWHIESVRVEEQRVFCAEPLSTSVHAGDEVAIGSLGGIGESAGGVVGAAHEHGAKQVEAAMTCAGDEPQLGWRLELVPDGNRHIPLQSTFGDDFHRREKFLSAGDGKAGIRIFFIERLTALRIDHDGTPSHDRRCVRRLVGVCHRDSHRSGGFKTRFDRRVRRCVGATIQNRKNKNGSDRSPNKKNETGTRFSFSILAQVVG